MKKLFGILMITIGLSATVFAQDDVENITTKKHQAFSHYISPSFGIGAMNMNDGAILTFNIGASYNFYVLDWFSISGSVLAHQELYFNQPTDNTRMVPAGNPFCITVPIGFHINVPGIDWLYTGISFALNFPMFDLNSPYNAYASSEELFFSLPIDLGLDLIKPDLGGSRILLRVTPTFHKGGIAVPVGLVWQIHNWKIPTQKTTTHTSSSSSTTVTTTTTIRTIEY